MCSLTGTWLRPIPEGDGVHTEQEEYEARTTALWRAARRCAVRDELDAMLGDTGSSGATAGSAPSEPSDPESDTETITVKVVPISDVAALVPDGFWSPPLACLHH